MHLILDGQAHNVKLMTDKKLMADWLVQVVKKADMQPFGKPFIYGFPWPGSKDCNALTAFQPLMESGLSIHCWPERNFVFIDLFSCNNFGESKVIAFIVDSFEMWRYKWLLLDRGIEPITSKIIPATLRRTSDER